MKFWAHIVGKYKNSPLIRVVMQNIWAWFVCIIILDFFFQFLHNHNPILFSLHFTHASFTFHTLIMEVNQMQKRESNLNAAAL